MLNASCLWFQKLLQLLFEIELLNKLHNPLQLGFQAITLSLGILQGKFHRAKGTYLLVEISDFLGGLLVLLFQLCNLGGQLVLLVLGCNLLFGEVRQSAVVLFGEGNLAAEKSLSCFYLVD